MRQAFAELCTNHNWHAVVVSILSLLELQKIDTALLQLLHRQANLEERAVLTKTKSTLAVLQNEHATLTAQLAVTKTQITNLEAANKKCEVQIAKYSQQLRTVIAPREAEALQHEIETVRAERGANDDQELLLLETSERLELQLKDLIDRVNAGSAAVTLATTALSEAIKGCEAEKKLFDGQRQIVAVAIDLKVIKLYDNKRNKRTTPAVADLHGSKCQSCHLDLSVVELAALKKIGDSEIAECPNCDCYLVV